MQISISLRLQVFINATNAAKDNYASMLALRLCVRESLMVLRCVHCVG